MLPVLLIALLVGQLLGPTHGDFQTPGSSTASSSPVPEPVVTDRSLPGGLGMQGKAFQQQHQQQYQQRAADIACCPSTLSPLLQAQNT
jgi:hypothetical protein